MIDMDTIESLAEQTARTREICALLIANGTIAKEEFRDLAYDQRLRESVCKRLDSVGMKLLDNPKSAHWGVGLSESTSADDRLEWSNNFGLDRGALGLMLILWCKLILPRRLAETSDAEESDFDNFKNLFPDIKSTDEAVTSVSRDQIVAEFSDILGGVTLISKYISQLARAKLIRAYGGIIKEGPLLSLVIDEDRLKDELHRDVLLSVLKRERKDR